MGWRLDLKQDREGGRDGEEEGGGEEGRARKERKGSARAAQRLITRYSLAHDGCTGLSVLITRKDGEICCTMLRIQRDRRANERDSCAEKSRSIVNGAA